MKIRNLDDLRNATDETTVKTIVTEYMMESIARNNILAKLEVDLDEKDDTETITIAELRQKLDDYNNEDFYKCTERKKRCQKQ